MTSVSTTPALETSRQLDRKLTSFPRYDCRDATIYISQRTGEPLHVVEEFLKLHFTYQSQKYGNVIETHNDAPEGESDLHEVFFEAVEMSIDDLTMELAFLTLKCHRDPRFNEGAIARMIAEEIGYMACIGIVPSEAYKWACDWSDWIATL